MLFAHGWGKSGYLADADQDIDGARIRSHQHRVTTRAYIGAGLRRWIETETGYSSSSALCKSEVSGPVEFSSLHLAFRPGITPSDGGINEAAGVRKISVYFTRWIAHGIMTGCERRDETAICVPVSFFSSFSRTDRP